MEGRAYSLAFWGQSTFVGRAINTFQMKGLALQHVA